MDESSLTGESDSLRKEPYEKCILMKNENSSSKVPSPLMLSGTNCVEGTGYGIVLAVGDHSQKGIIRRTVDNAQENSQTPLEKKLEVIAENIGWFGMVAGVITLVALTIRFIIHYLKNDKEYKRESSKKDLVNSIITNYPYFSQISSIKNEGDIILTNPKSEISANFLSDVYFALSLLIEALNLYKKSIKALSVLFFVSQYSVSPFIS